MTRVPSGDGDGDSHTAYCYGDDGEMVMVKEEPYFCDEDCGIVMTVMMMMVMLVKEEPYLCNDCDGDDGERGAILV